MLKASELKKGVIIDIDGTPHIVKQIESKSPSARGAVTLYRVRYMNLQTSQKAEAAYKGDYLLREADCRRVPVQFSYVDGDEYVFMNMEDYNQYSMAGDDLGDQIGYLTEGLEGITALLVEDRLRAIELPHSVDLAILDTAPEIKGATATGRTKPARLSTGIEVQVPEYLASGSLIRLNTVTGKYMSRA